MVKQDLNPWHARWSKNNIGFHQETVNDDLVEFVKNHKESLGQHVLVPLCGKSKDMLWLVEQGFKVTGVEISETAILDFFKESSLSCSVKTIPDGKHYSADNKDLVILQKSFFDLGTDELSPELSWVYDRASLIALDAELRKEYAKHLNVLSQKAANMLCICIEKRNGSLDGPPYGVNEKELRGLYADVWGSIEVNRSVMSEKTVKALYKLSK